MCIFGYKMNLTILVTIRGQLYQKNTRLHWLVTFRGATKVIKELTDLFISVNVVGPLTTSTGWLLLQWGSPYVTLVQLQVLFTKSRRDSLTTNKVFPWINQYIPFMQIQQNLNRTSSSWTHLWLLQFYCGMMCMP